MLKDIRKHLKKVSEDLPNISNQLKPGQMQPGLWKKGVGNNVWKIKRFRNFILNDNNSSTKKNDEQIGEKNNG